MSASRAILAALAAAATLALAAGSASAATTQTSSNWAGYVVEGATFSAVSGTWVQPAADCSTGETSSSAFWVGLGGNSETSNALEQAGTTADCSADGTTRYWAWYELVPAAAVKIPLKVVPGDTISASVEVSGTTVTMQVRNLTRGTSVTKTRTIAAPDTSSAEWIAEAPSLCSSNGVCRTTALTKFGTVKFRKATATSDGHTGSISDRAWTRTAIHLVTDAGPRFGRYVDYSSAAEAVPTALSAGGSAFAVKWLEGDAATVDPGPPGWG